jgi:hypothetical protein
LLCGVALGNRGGEVVGVHHVRLHQVPRGAAMK